MNAFNITSGFADATPTIQDVVRAGDRTRVRNARQARRPLWLLLLLAGPGILTMLSENDGPSMLSYAITGATYGIGFFVPFILLTFAMAYVVQEATVRIGIATHRGHAELIFDRFGRFWGYFAMFDLSIGNLLTLMTEFIAIRAGAAYFGIPAWLAIFASVVVVAIAFRTRSYFTWERFAMALALANLLFIPVALQAHPNVPVLEHALAFWGPLPGGFSGTFLLIVLANVGATVTPWMIFFQQSAVADKGLTQADLPQGRIDTAVGAGIAAAVAIATLVAVGPLFAHHVDVTRFQGGADFATALRGYIGGPAAALFALGMMEAGLVAAITISTSSAYAAGEVLKTGRSKNLPFSHGRAFYLTGIVSILIAAAVVLIPHAPLLAMTLTVNVLATILMAPALLFVLLLVNDREIMGSLANGFRSNLAGGLVIVSISLLGAAYGIVTVFPHLVR